MESSDLKICVCFIAEVPYTTGVHIFNACKKLYPKTVYAPPHALPSDCDIYFHVDSGHEHTRILSPKDKTIFYAIDDYQNHPKFDMKTRLPWWGHVIENTYMFVDAVKYGAAWLKTKHDKVHYIAMGYDPDLYHYEDLEKKYDICFIGSHYGTRKRILQEASKHFSLYAPAWRDNPTYGASLRRAACSSRCFLDISPIEENIFGQRFFEGYACKVPMVCMDRPCIKPYLDDGIVLYDLKNLGETLAPAIEKAIKIEAPIERSLTGEAIEAKMAWTEKVSFVIETYKKYRTCERI